MKKLLIGLLALASVSSFAENGEITIECFNSNGAKMVSAVIDIETGENNYFLHYALGKPSPSLIYHFETDPEATEEGNFLEIYTQMTDGTPIAKLGIKDPKVIDGNISGTGKLNVAHVQSEIEKSQLDCSLSY